MVSRGENVDVNKMEPTEGQRARIGCWPSIALSGGNEQAARMFFEVVVLLFIELPQRWTTLSQLSWSCRLHAGRCCLARHGVCSVYHGAWPVTGSQIFTE